MSQQMKKNGNNYFLVIINELDEYEHPLFVCDYLWECAEWLGCNLSTLYRHKRYKNFIIKLVKDVEDGI